MYLTDIDHQIPLLKRVTDSVTENLHNLVEKPLLVKVEFSGAFKYWIQLKDQNKILIEIRKNINGNFLTKKWLDLTQGKYIKFYLHMTIESENG